MWPPDWRTWISAIAVTFHPSLSELMKLTVKDLEFWAERVDEVNKANKGR